ncbi:MAG TPA: ABC transporter substrate-binding protein, partial [Trueperaceae bacterium]|nr:ABC transporter substrate-binding protein [Trueperaceae bacterium]
AAAAMVALLLVPSALAQRGDADSITVAQGLDPRSLSPLSSTTQQEKNVSGQIVERLLIYTHDGGGFIPILAREWEMIAPDTLQLRLQEGVSFTNGEPFNAEAAAYSVNLMIQAPAYLGFTGMLNRAEVVDEYTINVITNQPAPERLVVTALALGSFVYPPVYTEEVGFLEGFATAPVGTGPFMLRQWLKDEAVILDANPDYWGGQPRIGTLIFRPIPEGSARVAALEAGDIDFSIEIPLDAWQRVSNNPDLVSINATGGRGFRLTFATLWEGPLGNRTVREAISHAIDRESIVEFMFSGLGTLMDGQPITEATAGFNPELHNAPYDPARARELLAEAGFPNGFEMTFKYSSGRYAQDRAVGELIAAQLQEIGITVNQVVLESGEFLNQLNALELRDMFYSGALSPTDGHFQYTTYTCAFRYAYWCNEEFDAIVDQAQYETDPAAREALYQRAGQLLHDDWAILPLFTTNDLYAHAPEVTGFQPMLDQFLDFRSLNKE